MGRNEELNLVFDHLIEDVNKDINISDPKTRALFAIAIGIRMLCDTNNNIGPKLGDTRKMHCKECRKETDHLHGKERTTGRLYWECLECRYMVYFALKER